MDTFRRWGVVASSALCPVLQRVLIMIDGRIDTTSAPGVFGLGYVLATLRDTAAAWWVRYEVQVVRRDDGSLTLGPWDEDDGYSDGSLPPFPTRLFRITDPRFDINDWHQLWFFGDLPANGEGDHNASAYSPLEDEELRILAEWMDRGGGVFATGDHWNLGASMCSRIPRVRTMRRWTPAQGVPPQDGDRRHQTLQPAPGGEVAQESDLAAQPIDVVHRRVVLSMLSRGAWPHALLAGPDGVIDSFPDHMHEGSVVDDHAVELAKPLDIPGYSQPEYPATGPVIDPGMTALAPGAGLTEFRPRPQVIAYGQTTNPAPLVLDDTAIHDPSMPGHLAKFASNALVTTRFGLIGTYDGDRVGVGRVVVESTWHHWFSLNLHAFHDADSSVYRNMQTYYRNVGLWLAPRSVRRGLLVSAVWGVVASDPMAFPRDGSRSLWAVGHRAVDVIRRTLSAPMLLEFVLAYVDASDEISGAPALEDAEPYAGGVPADLIIRAVVGGMASALIEPAVQYRRVGSDARRLVDRHAIERRAAEGARQGHRALVDALGSAATATRDLASRLTDAFRTSTVAPLAVKTATIRVLAERLQIPDLRDPMVAGTDEADWQRGARRLAVTIRAIVGGVPSSDIVVESAEIERSARGDGWIMLDQPIFDGVVQSGEPLTIEVSAGQRGARHNGPETVRFAETLSGQPSAWGGSYIPAASQPWRLWYRVDATTDEGAAGE